MPTEIREYTSAVPHARGVGWWRRMKCCRPRSLACLLPIHCTLPPTPLVVVFETTNAHSPCALPCQCRPPLTPLSRPHIPMPCATTTAPRLQQRRVHGFRYTGKGTQSQLSYLPSTWPPSIAFPYPTQTLPNPEPDHHLGPNPSAFTLTMCNTNIPQP